METRQLAGTDLTVSRICLGTMTFGSQTAEADARRMVDLALGAGVNFFDTANVYNQGASEEMIGRCLGARRKDVVLASKVRGAMGDPKEYEGLSAAAIRRGLEASLRRLGTDYLDVYYLHQPDYDTPIEETLETMDGLVREGKVRYAAVSNYSAWQICDMFRVSGARGWSAPRISQPMYNVLARGIEQEYLAFCHRYGISNVVYNPLAGGLLTGKQSISSGPIAGSRFDGNRMYLDRYWHSQYFEAVEDCKKVAEEAGRPLLEIAFRWLLDLDGVDSVIVGASKVGHFEANLAAAATAPISTEIRDACDNIWDALRGPTPVYNR